jgi:predicted GIY-YIG superfamily endonuclease
MYVYESWPSNTLTNSQIRSLLRTAKSELDGAIERWNSTAEELNKRSDSDDLDFLFSLGEELHLLDYEIEELEVEIDRLSKILETSKSKSKTVSQTLDENAEILIEVQLSEKLLRRLKNISEYDLKLNPKKSRIRLYIIQVAPLNKTGKQYVFYVGLTGNDIEKRLAQHESGGKLAWSKLKSTRKTHKITWYRWDLFGDLPEFASKRAAQKAEGLIADYLNRRGFSAYSDQMKDQYKKS